MTTSLRDLLADGRVHVLDGAMGTVLYSKGIFVNVCYDELNLKNPKLVREVHEDYVNAGAEIIETNTFGANPVKLSAFGLDDSTEAINRAAVEIAREAARGRARVVGAVGPLGIRIEPFGPTSREEAVDLFARQARGLLEGGVDGFILETFSDLDEIHAAFKAVRGLGDLPILALMSFDEEGNTAYGTSVEAVARSISEWGADVVGLNCSVGPAAMLDAVERMIQVTDVPIAAQPNAGLPRDVGDRKIYMAGPEYVARYALRMVEAGARFVGGCCGTTPDHTRKIVEMVAGTSPRAPAVYVPRSEVEAPAGVAPLPLAERSRWGRKIAHSEFVRTVEVLPPRGWHTAEMIERGRALYLAGVDAVTVMTGPRARNRMGALSTAGIVQRELGVEAVVHYRCRERDMLSMVGDLLGAAATGIHNLVLVTGQPPGTARNGFSGAPDIDSIGLTNVVYHLNHGLDPGSNPIGEPTQFVIGVVVNHGALDPDHELKRFYWKVDAGAEFAVTQPVFDPAQFLRFLKRIEQYGIPVVAGIRPLRSLRDAEYLCNEVPDVAVPASVVARMRAAQERGDEAAAAEGVEIAREVLAELHGAVQGVQVSAPARRFDLALAVLES